MEPLDRLDKDSILTERVFQELFDQEDEIKKASYFYALPYGYKLGSYPA